MKKISVVIPCFNEEENIDEIYLRIINTFKNLKYEYEVIFIDNCSTDTTVDKIKLLAKLDKNLKLIINSRNFGHIRSQFHVILQSSGDACIMIAADLQDPPELIPDLILKWEAGHDVILCVKPESKESKLMFFLRKKYYSFLSSISEVPLVQNATGAGLFDKKIVNILRGISDPYPYFRGLVSEIGFNITTIEFLQPKRKHGITKYGFYNLLDVALLGIINHSKVPLRFMSIIGFICSVTSLFIAFFYLIAKLFFWNSFSLGIAPIIIGIFLVSSLQILMLGLIGEYVGSIHTKLRKMPLIIEKERINF